MGYKKFKGDEKYTSKLTQQFTVILNSIEFELPNFIEFQMLELSIIFLDLVPGLPPRGGGSELFFCK